MRRVDDSQEDEVKRCYLPHHHVVKESSTTTKVMVVADVEKMFRQINMHQIDVPLQSILWRFQAHEEMVNTFELTTVTYGTKPAPFLATRTLKQLAFDEQGRFPLAAQAADEDIYMDDVISGAGDIETALQLRMQFDSMMLSGGFRLRKWVSNCERVLEGIPKEIRALPEADEITWDKDDTVKTLGLSWLHKTDCLKFQFTIPTLTPNQFLTKRMILSIIASLFDPLGILEATIVMAKIYMQQLWNYRNKDGQRLEWDESIPTTVGEKWRRYQLQLPSLNLLRIPRCAVAPKSVNIEIHCFSDASEKAYGACLFLRSRDTNGRITVQLLTSKSKVAPLMVQTLPRLELCGALLAAQLVEKVSDVVKGYFGKSFLASRLISRGILPNALEGNSLWWEGPDWLLEEADKWLSQPNINCTDAPEMRRSTVTVIATKLPTFTTSFIVKFPSYSQLIRATAYWLRLIAILQHKESGKRKGFLSTNELREAETVILRKVQQESFGDDLNALKGGKSVSRGSPLRWFIPAIGEDGILQVQVAG
ncbi:uncharacterized protein LOC131694744 [Topomyia yanbarensis]|uniref:uncharacterized protein LOC131694744 n=1 Tax=Topomyia yanbarensis TaxID=2498891 RepID=UPI00273BD2A3|nr:uncharacterized protein LOC131694744 [Topomyia yanbarensis]